MFILIRLLLTMIALCYVQGETPQGCICYNPYAINPTDNSTVPCNGAQCSRGDNLDCFSDEDVDGTITTYRAFGFYIPYRSGDDNEFYRFVFGCNCPGFHYNNGTGGNNGLANTAANAYSYIYNNCTDFSLGINDAAYCCNYCCGSPYVPTTIGTSITSSLPSTRIPSSATSTYYFYPFLIYALIFLSHHSVQNN